LRSAGHDAHRPLAPALIQQEHPRRRVVAVDGEPRHPVAQLDRQIDRGLRRGFARRVFGARHRQGAAVLGAGARRRAAGRLGRCAQQIDGQPVHLGLGRAHDQGQRLRRRSQHGEAAQPLQLFGQGAIGGAVAGKPVRDPICVGRALEAERVERRRRTRPVGAPRLGRQRAQLIARFAGRHQPAGADRTAFRRRRGGQQHDRQILPLRLVDQRVGRVEAILPVRARGPAIVDRQHQRPAAGESRRGVEDRPGEAENDQRGEQQAQQQEPGRRAFRRFLPRAQIHQQADGGEALPPRRRRDQPQQPPQHRQRRQRRQQPRAGEGEGAQSQHVPARAACVLRDAPPSP
jgi:hypothetical protein